MSHALEIHRPAPVAAIDLEAVPRDDAELLALFCEAGDREAIESLIHRYAPLVASICRSLIADRQAAEDAFQATFLIFVRKAKSIRRRRSLSAWLHGVAYRTACRQRQKLRKLTPRGGTETNEAEPAMEPHIVEDPLARLTRQLDLEALMIEVESLPPRLRDPIVEHYLHGRTMQSVAERMELSLAAVEGRIRRGRSILRNRLAQKGMALSVALAAANWCRTEAVAAESGAWTQRLLDGIDVATPGTVRGVDMDRLSELIQGEIGMKRLLASSALLIGGAVAMTATGFLVAAPSVRSAGGGGTAAEVTLDGSPAVSPGPFALVQAEAAADPFSASQESEPRQASPGRRPTPRAAAADPFGGSASENPFGGDAAADPFSGGANPFGAGVAADPFSGGANPTGSTPPPASARGRNSAPAGGRALAQDGGSGGAQQSPAQAAYGAAAKASPGPAEKSDAESQWRIPEGAMPDWLAAGRTQVEAFDAEYKQFREALQREFSPEYNGQPLRSVMSDISDQFQMPIVLDDKAMEQGISGPDDPVTLTGIGEIPLDTALRLILEPLELTHAWKDSVVFITTPDELSNYNLLRYYELSYVLPNDAPTAELIALIQMVIPAGWDSGEARITAFGSLLVVDAPEKTHRAVETVLARIGQMPRENFDREWLKLPMPHGVEGGLGGGGMGGMGGGGMGGGGMGGGGGFF